MQFCFFCNKYLSCSRSQSRLKSKSEQYGDLLIGMQYLNIYIHFCRDILDFVVSGVRGFCCYLTFANFIADKWNYYCFRSKRYEYINATLFQSSFSSDNYYWCNALTVCSKAIKVHSAECEWKFNICHWNNITTAENVWWHDFVVLDVCRWIIVILFC